MLFRGCAARCSCPSALVLIHDMLSAQIDPDFTRSQAGLANKYVHMHAGMHACTRMHACTHTNAVDIMTPWGLLGLAPITSMLDRHWVDVRCEVCEATPAVAEVSEASNATCLYILIGTDYMQVS